MPVFLQSDISSNTTVAAGQIVGYWDRSNSAPQFTMFRSVLTSPAYLAGVRAAVDAASAGACIAVDPFTLGSLARVALGGSNNDRVSYVWDTLPTEASPGATLSFTVTLRNDGWNVLKSMDYELRVSINRVELLMQASGERPAVGALRLDTAGSPLRTALHRQGFVKDSSVSASLLFNAA